ncbi:MAG TPA: hypothetical protein VNA65_01235 [Candidatus Dormibacteraeota bacterium]|nr:hypothetical protein [Candidatus Dormibacteraeota bacterium]
MAVEPRIDDSPIPRTQTDLPHDSLLGEVTIVSVPRVIEMYSVSERELDQISVASTSFAVHLVFFGITFGASIAFLISLLTAELSNRMFALVWALFVLTLATIYFGVQANRSYHDAGRGVRTIKRESHKGSAG